MQKVIAKYGLAAHLALLAVAPLFLYPFVGERTVAAVLLWLSLPAAAWTLLEPSLRVGEGTGVARRRVLWMIGHDPLFWATFALVVMSGVWALNTGIELAYDAEKARWGISEAVFPILPGAVGSSGFLPFAGSVALMIILQGCRHSLGRSARMAFLLSASFFSGLAAVITLLQAYLSHRGLEALCKAADASCSYAGFSHGLLLLCGITAMATAFERRWRVAMLLLIVGIGGNAAAAFLLSTDYQVAAFLVVTVVVLVSAFVYSHFVASSGADFKLLVLGSVSLVLGGLLVALVVPADALTARLANLQEFVFFPEKFWERRAMLSAIALKSWVSHLWTGTGLASFPLDFRFNAVEAEWTLFPLGVSSLSNGWWWVLAERGLIGMAFYALPFAFLAFTYIRRLARGIRKMAMLHPACLLAPVVLVLVAADGFLDCAPMRVEAILVTGAMMAVSAASLPREKRESNG